MPRPRKVKPPKPQPGRRVVFQPAAQDGLQSGINQLVDAIRPTLGPLPRIVAYDRGPGDKTPELLDNGGLIARRIVGLANRDADMGAMLLRSLLWRLHERFGDGTATAAVLFHSVYNLGLRHLVAGGNAMRLRQYLEAGLRAILAELTTMVVPVRGQAQLTQMAEALCFDPKLAKMLGEILDVVGEYGQLDIKEGQGRHLEREYYEGSYWKSGLTSRALFERAERKVNVTDAAIFVSDVAFNEPSEVAEVIELARQAGAHALLIVALEFSEQALLTVLSANRAAKDFRTLLIKTPGQTVDDQMAALEDLSVLAGGRTFWRAAGQTPHGVKPDDLGHARRAWADAYAFGIVGGRGNPRALRQHLSQLKSAHAQTHKPELRERFQHRIGKLSGGAATLWIGGATDPEIKARKALAERTSAALRGALIEGVLPGAGGALLACIPSLRARQRAATDPEEQAACRILSESLSAPTRAIIRNAGLDPNRALAQLAEAGPGVGFDVRSGELVQLAAVGLLDVAPVLKAAIHGAVSSAALALTVEVLIHHKQPVTVYEP